MTRLTSLYNIFDVKITAYQTRITNTERKKKEKSWNKNNERKKKKTLKNLKYLFVERHELVLLLVFLPYIKSIIA